MKNSVAIAKVVVLEMYRRKDFYVLFALTVLITGLMASVTFFDDPKIGRYLKEICLGLIWLSSLFIAVATMAHCPVPRESALSALASTASHETRSFNFLCRAAPEISCKARSAA